MKKFLLMFLGFTVLLLSFTVTVSAARRYEYTVNEIKFTDVSKNEYSTVPYGTNVNVDVSVTTNYAVEGAKLVIASYDFDDTLCQIEIFDITANEDETVVLSTEMIAAYDRYVKSFVLMSLTDPIPVSNYVDKGFTYGFKEFRTEDIYDNKTYIDQVAVYNENGRYDYYDLYITEIYINGSVRLSTDIETEYGTLYAGEKIRPNHIEMILEHYLSSERAADIRIEGESENYTTMHITEYQTYVVSEINSSRSSIISREGQRIIFDDYYDFKIIKNGEEIEFDEICVDDVLSIAGYINNYKELEFGTVIVNSDTVVGRVNMFNHASNEITIDNVTYCYDVNNIYPVGLLGSSVVARFDARGTIVALDEYTGVIEPDEGGEDVDEEINENALLTISGLTLTTNASGVEGTVVKGLQNGVETEVFVRYDMEIIKADFNLSDFRNSTIPGTLGKGDAILLEKGSDEELSKVIIVMDSSDYIGDYELANNNTYTTLGTCDEDGDEYTYAIGFVAEAEHDYVKLMAGTPESGDKINNNSYTEYNLAGFSDIVCYNAYYVSGKGMGKTEIADISDVEAIYTYFESSQGNTTEHIDSVGDMAFLRINESTDKAEMIILKNGNY